MNPNGLQNQVSGAIVQGIGGALFETVKFENGKILNPHFSEYRVPRFSDLPEIDVVLSIVRTSPPWAPARPYHRISTRHLQARFSKPREPPTFLAARSRRHPSEHETVVSSRTTFWTNSVHISFNPAVRRQISLSEQAVRVRAVDYNPQ